MAIEKIGAGGPILPAGESKKEKVAKAPKQEKTDKVELSEEAKSLYAAEREKKLDEIREKVKNGFYDAPEVTEKVVEGLKRDLKRYPEA